MPCSRAEAHKYWGNEEALCSLGRRELHILQQKLQHTGLMSPGTVTATQILRCEILDVKQHKRFLWLQLKQKWEGCTCPSVPARVECQLSSPAPQIFSGEKGAVAWLAEEGALCQSLSADPRSQLWQGVDPTLESAGEEHCNGDHPSRSTFQSHPYNYYSSGTSPCHPGTAGFCCAAPNTFPKLLWLL